MQEDLAGSSATPHTRCVPKVRPKVKKATHRLENPERLVMYVRVKSEEHAKQASEVIRTRSPASRPR